jgi:RNA polymerase sigma-70 factor (ECF subfamily)
MTFSPPGRILAALDRETPGRWGVKIFFDRSRPVDDSARRRIEEGVRASCERGDFDAAATAAIKGYGPEILGFLAALHRQEEDAADVFSLFSEKLWRGLPSFGWQSSLRTWAYTIARNTSYSFQRHAKRDRGKIGLSEASIAGRLAAKVRTETRSFLKTEQKDRFAVLRDSLDEEDKTLLILRVDRQMAWEDLARVMMDGAGSAEPSDADLKRESARLRKRFQLVKEKLLALGEKTGLKKKV